MSSSWREPSTRAISSAVGAGMRPGVYWGDKPPGTSTGGEPARRLEPLTVRHDGAWGYYGALPDNRTLLDAAPGPHPHVGADYASAHDRAADNRHPARE